MELLEVWSVDTCQMWLAGWGHIIDKHKQVTRIVQLPGDIRIVEGNQTRFFANLKAFVRDPADIVVGDFNIRNKYSAKELIDTYGTYPLLANWFPDLFKGIQKLPLNRPRSEFLNIRVAVLEELLVVGRIR